VEFWFAFAAECAIVFMKACELGLEHRVEAYGVFL